jgi:membrane fusion protein (multidrug efflux system)
MKKTIYLALVLLMAACGNSEIGNHELNDLIQKRDSLRAEQEKIVALMGELDAKISELDTTKRRTLVSVIHPDTGSFEHYFEIYGNVDVKRNALLIPENPGNVISILVKEGQNVSQGQVIMRLDDELIRKNIQELETNYQLAKTVFEKQEGLWNQKIGSELQYLEAKARKESLENTKETLNKQLEKSTIRAPFAGVVDNIMIKVGEMASPGMPVARIIDLSDYHIEADIPEKYIATLSKGNRVDVIFPGVDTVKASISSVGNYIHPGNRTFLIQVDVDEKNGRFKPNQLTTLRINDYSKENAVMLPSSAIQQDAQGKNFVFVAENGSNFHTVRKKVIETGMSYNGKTHVLSGLKGNEKIIDKGARSVRDQQEVEVKLN